MHQTNFIQNWPVFILSKQKCYPIQHKINFHSGMINLPYFLIEYRENLLKITLK